MKHRIKTIILAMTLASLATAAFALQEAAQDAPAIPASAQGSAPAVAKPTPTTQNNPPAQAPAAVLPTGKPAAVVVAKQTGSKATAPKGAPAKPAKPPKPPWEEFKLDSKATMLLDFTDANPDMIISLFARTSGITILKDPTFKSTLTFASAKSVNLNDAFEILNTVLGMNGYELQKQGKLLMVAKKAPPAPPMMPPQPPPAPPVDDKAYVKLYPLKFASATQVAKIINEVFTPAQLEQIMQQLQQGGGGMPPGMQPGMGGRPGAPPPPKIVRASADEYGNNVIVNAPKAYQDQVKEFIDQIDKSATMPLTSKVYQLKFVAVDEVIDAIKDVLTANAPLGRGGGKSQDNNNNQFGYYYRSYGMSDTKTSGAQSAVEVKQTNSVIVSATDDNIKLIDQLIANLDRKNAIVGTTFVIPLENAKATDIATLLNQVFTPRKDNQNENPYMYFYSDMQNPEKKSTFTTDTDQDGNIVNVRDLTNKVNVIADPNTNSLVVVTQPSFIPFVERIVKKLDSISTQVMIETVIVEADLTKETKLGVEWNLPAFKVLNSSKNTATGSTNFGLQSSTTPLQGLQYTLNGSGYKAFLNALQTDTRFKVLSTPRIFTSNNVKAIINVSQGLPYVSSTQVSTLGTPIYGVTYYPKDVGVVLTVTPRITSSGQVSMDVDQTASDLENYTSFNAPIVNTREATTTVSVKDGDTVILGGIIRRNTHLTANKVPLLGDLPLIGGLFRSTDHTVEKTELLVLLTPHIVWHPSDAQDLRREGTKDLSKESQGDLKQVVPPIPDSGDKK